MIDVALTLLLVVAAVRGYVRGIVREACSLLALVAGLYAAFSLAPTVEAVVASRYVLPSSVGAGVAFVAVFASVYVVFSIAGVFLDRRGSGALARVATGLAGAVVGGGKAGAVAAFVLLFAHLFPVAPGLERQVMSSSLGRPIVATAERAIRVGSARWGLARNAGES